MEYIMKAGGKEGRGQNIKETDDRAIALFDSGMGGLTCVKALKRELPGESIIYYGDCLRAPYGDRSVETLKVFSQQIADFLTSFPVKMLVVACNTISSLCLGNLKDRYPMLPVEGMIDMTVKTVAETYPDRNIGIIATSAAIKSGTYVKKLRESGCKGKLYPLACPGFVPAVEASPRSRQCCRLPAGYCRRQTCSRTESPAAQPERPPPFFGFLSSFFLLLTVRLIIRFCGIATACFYHNIKQRRWQEL